MASAPKFNYSAKNFVDYRNEIINYITAYYPNIFSDFSDASVGAMLIDINAGIADELSYHLDRNLNEGLVNYAQQRKSLMDKARTHGVKIPNKIPSVSIVDFSVTVPVKGDTFDTSYCPIIKRNAQLSGGGKSFENVYDIDFSSKYSSSGVPNRKEVPNLDANNEIQNYTITKREIVTNGVTKIMPRVITTDDVKPFFTITLREPDVYSVDSIILLDGTNYSTAPNSEDFYNDSNGTRWYEVDYLAQDKIFIEDETYQYSGSTANIKKGQYLDVSRKFITELTDKYFTKVIFGSGTSDYTGINSNNIDEAILDNLLTNFVNNLSLGEIPSPNKTMFIRYRVGGGADTNVGVNIINKVSNANIVINGDDSRKNSAVKASLKVNNPIPAIGGKDNLTIEELRYLIKYNNAAQERCVTLPDYRSRITKMPSEFGSPFRSSAYEYNNKIAIPILTLDEDGKLNPETSSVLTENLSEYISYYKSDNDFVEVFGGKIINLGYEIDVILNKNVPTNQTILNIINTVKEFNDINNSKMGDNIYIGQLKAKIIAINGVVSVSDIRAYNKVGGKYSNNKILQTLSNTTTNQIDLLGEEILFGEPDSMFEVKYPEKDILVRIKNI